MCFLYYKRCVIILSLVIINRTLSPKAEITSYHRLRVVVLCCVSVRPSIQKVKGAKGMRWYSDMGALNISNSEHSQLPWARTFCSHHKSSEGGRIDSLASGCALVMLVANLRGSSAAVPR